MMMMVVVLDTEIDWIAYMQEVAGVLVDHHYDYSVLKGGIVLYRIIACVLYWRSSDGYDAWLVH